MKHLWEVEHAYYCSDHNYFSCECHLEFDTFAEFLEEEGDADLDYNLVFRWDWHKPDEDQVGDQLEIFIIGQRKGLFRSVTVNVTEEDEPAVIEYLKPRLAHLQKLWAPLSQVEWTAA